MNLTDKIESILEPSLTHEGYSIVRILISGQVRKVVQIMIERLNGDNITIDDCVYVSRHVSPLLDVDDPLPFSYTLEVSSPGLDRPLVKPKDFVRFSGHRIKLSLNECVLNRKRLITQLLSADDGGITIEMEKDGEIIPCSVPYHAIQTAKLYIDFNDHVVKKGKTSGKPKN